MTVLVDGEEIKTIKYFFCSKNALFDSLINDRLFNGCLELSSEVNKNGFYILERYYSNGVIEFDDNNFIDILKICCYYNENKLLHECEEYVIYNANEKMMRILLDNEILLEFVVLEKLRNFEIEYFRINGYKFLYYGILFIYYRRNDNFIK